MLLILYVSSVAMYLLEPVGCRIDPKGPSNIYIYSLVFKKGRPWWGRWAYIYIYTLLGVLSPSVWQITLNIFCTRLLPSGLPEAVRPSGSSVIGLHRGAATGCLNRFVSKGVFLWPNRRQLCFNDIHMFNVFILFQSISFWDRLS